MFKRIIICFAMMCFCCDAFADTINIDWIVGGQQYQTSSCTVGGDLNVPTPPEKYGYNFLGWVSFTPIEYIETTGTQYINTGIIANQDTRVMMIVLLPASSATQVGIFGSNVFFVRSASNTFSINVCNKWASNASYMTNQKTTLDLNKNVFSVLDNGGNLLSSSTVAQEECTSNGNLFIGKINNVNAVIPQMKIYSVKIWDNDELVRNFIPVLDANGIACLYDLVSNEYFYNVGTGDFTPGPELTE